jgi:hypothetical protein
MKETLQILRNQKVVVDTRSTWIYIGTLSEIQSDCLLLTDVDVHDSSEGHKPKEVYVHETRASGVKANRQSVYVNLEFVVSVSLLADVIKF